MKTKSKPASVPASKKEPESAEKAKPDKETEVVYPQKEATNTPKPEVAGAEVGKDTAPKSNDESTNDQEPRVVQRIHKLYEELGREDVEEAQEWEKQHPPEKDVPDK